MSVSHTVKCSCLFSWQHSDSYDCFSFISFLQKQIGIVSLQGWTISKEAIAYHQSKLRNCKNEELPTQPRASELSRRGQMVKNPPWKVTGKSEIVEFSRCELFNWNIPVIAGGKLKGTGIPGNEFSKMSLNLAMLSSFLDILEDTVPFVTDNFWNFQTGSFGRVESALVLARQTSLLTYLFTYR